MSTEKVLVGVLAGIATGAVLGILFAPDKGSETRKKIARKSNDTVEGIKEKFEDLLSSFTQKFDVMKEDALDIYNKSASNLSDKDKSTDY